MARNCGKRDFAGHSRNLRKPEIKKGAQTAAEAATHGQGRAPRDPETLVNKIEPGETPEEAMAAMMIEGVSMNAVASVRYSKTLGTLDLTAPAVALEKQAERVQSGDLAGLEALLAAQAVTLNTIFTQVILQASNSTLLEHIDRLTRLAFKAQSQCRTTVETLAPIKGGPRTVFARQANIAAGPQRVNNVATVHEGSHARAGNSAPIELLEAQRHVERVDTGTSAATGCRDQALPNSF
jgi:hypothetical protein